MRRLDGRRAAAQRQAGFSLVELMVAIALGVIVMGAVLASFAGSRAASRSTLGISALTDAGRFALSTLSQGIRGAGFLACTSTVQFSAQTIMNPTGTPTPVAFAFQYPLNGYEAVGTAPGAAIAVAATPAKDTNAFDWIGGLDSQLIGGASPQPVIARSDILAVHTSLPGAPAYVTALTGANDFTVNTAANLATNQLAAVSDCANATTFVVKGVNGTDVSYGAGGAAPGNSGSGISIGLNVGSIVQAITTTVYYIGKGADGDGALFSAAWNPSAGSFTPQELVPDVENMQILYGIDTTVVSPPGTVTEYVTADAVTDWTRVLSVRIALLAASGTGATPPPSGAPTPFPLLGTVVTPPADTRRRQVFTTTVTLRDTAP